MPVGGRVIDEYEPVKNCCCGMVECRGLPLLSKPGRYMTLCLCILIGLFALLMCVFGDSVGSYDALKGDTWSHLDDDERVGQLEKYYQSCELEGDISEEANAALGLFLAAFAMIVVFTIWALALSRGCKFCCAPCDNRDKFCCINTLLAFAIIFLVFSMGFLLWMITLMGLDKYSCNTCHNRNANIGTLNSILNGPDDCVKQNYLEIERAGIATIGGFFGFLALLFAGMYCVACYEEPPPPPPREKPVSIPLHLIRDEDEEDPNKPKDQTLYSSHDAPAPEQQMEYYPPGNHFMPDGYMPMEQSQMGYPEMGYSGHPELMYGAPQQPYGNSQAPIYPRRSFLGEANM